MILIPMLIQVQLARSAVADLGSQLQGILDKTSYDDSTYSNVTKLTSKDTSPFFTQFMETKSGGLY